MCRAAQFGLRQGVALLAKNKEYGPLDRADLLPQALKFERARRAALDKAGQVALRADLGAYWTEHNQATDGTTALDSELLLVSAVRA